jgi:hypothetical protein
MGGESETVRQVAADINIYKYVALQTIGTQTVIQL